MNTMNMPGFTAEASLYKNSKNYHSVRIVNVLDESQVILPQTRCYILEAEEMCGIFGICDAPYGGMVCYR